LPHAERGGKRKSDVRGGDGRPSFGKIRASRRSTSAQPLDRARQCFVLVRAILLLGQHGSALLAFLLGSNISHDAVDSDGVAPLVEAFDYDCSLTRFHGGTMHFDRLIFVFSDLAQDPCRT
jgi:hypothetical protein